ncbi:hypothetical protein F5878DRAFT_123942, partial [Lentinula raphanica]
MPSVFGLFDTLHSVTVEKILGFLDFIELQHLRRTCHTANIYVADFHRRAYNISHILLPYLNDVEIKEFRGIQASTGMVISGSSALQFFNRETYDTEHHHPDLDTYCLLGKCDVVGRWLLSTGYEYHPRRNQLQSFQDDFDKKQSTSNTPADTDLVSEHYPSRTFIAVWNFV